MIVILALLALLALLVGCGGTADIHAGIGRGALGLQVRAEPMIRQWRRDAMTGEADRVHGAGGTREQAEGAVAAMSRRWQCAIEGHRIFGSAVSAYVDAVYLENVTGGDFDISMMLRFLRPVLDAYRAVAACISSLGEFELPVPDFMDLIPPAWGLGGGDDG